MPRKSTIQAKRRYQAAKVKRAYIEFYPTETDLWEHLQAQPNKAGYIKALIAADMGRVDESVDESSRPDLNAD